MMIKLYGGPADGAEIDTDKMDCPLSQMIRVAIPPDPDEPMEEWGSGVYYRFRPDAEKAHYVVEKYPA